jgi:hypothetical protein
MTCAICFDEMDMKEFKDEIDGTDTCHKLECGHAFHTKCIVDFLTKTRQACPGCNKIRPPDQQLEIEGLLRKTLSQVKNDARVRVAKEEFKTGKEEYRLALKQLEKEGKAWLDKRSAELKIKEYRSYYYSSATAVMAAAREVAKEMGPKYLAAVNSDRTPNNRWGPSVSKKTIFGSNPPGFRDWRLRHPRIWIRL